MRKINLLKTIVPLGLAFVSIAKADFTPVTLLPSSFNADVIVEKTAPRPLAMFTTATADQGTNNAGNTFYEIGYNTNADAVLTGFPLHGTYITNSYGDSVYLMPPTYTTNNCVLVGHNNGAGSPIITNGTLSLVTPGNYQYLSILNCSGNGPVPVRVVVHYTDSTTSETSFLSYDWFANVVTPVYSCKGRISGATFQNVNGAGMNLNSYEIGVDNSRTVASLEFIYNGTAADNGRAMIFAISGSSDGSFFSPIPVTGFTQDVIIEAEASQPTRYVGYTTVSMDGGTNNTGNTWYEQGFFPRFPNSGLPPAGSTFVSASLPDHSYKMPASYSGNNAIYVDTNLQTANITLATPAPYSVLSFLSATANGNVTNQCVIQYADGSSETNTFVSRDWFNNTPYAFASLGRVNLDNKLVDNAPYQTSTPNPRLYEAQFALKKINVAVTNIVLKWIGAANPATGRVVIFAVSGTCCEYPPIIASVSPVSSALYETNTLTISAAITGGLEPISYQWQVGTNGTFVNLANGANISGVNTTNLVFSSLLPKNVADYRLVASNSVGTAISGIASITKVVSPLPDVTTPGDSIVTFSGVASGNAAEAPTAAIDNKIQKYLVFGPAGNATPFVGPVGFTVTPSIGSTVVSAMRFYTANDAEQRDPKDITLEGSNDGGNTWTLITTNSLAMPAARNTVVADVINPLVHNLQEIRFANTTGYKAYKLTVYNVKNNTTANSMQLGEIEILGTLTPVPPVITRQPLANVTTYVGGAPTFGVAVSGPTPWTYEWYVGNTKIQDATNATYTLNNAQMADSGKTFKVRITNPYGTTESQISTLTVIPAPTGSYATTVLGSAPVGYWRLGESPNNYPNNGVVAYDYRGGHNGVYSNADLSMPGYSTIDADTAAAFGISAATDSVVTGIYDIDFAASTNAIVNFSVEAWVNGAAQTNDAGIVTKGYGGGGEQFNLDTGGSNPAHAFRFFYRDASGNTHAAIGTAPLDNKWHHVVGVCDQANGIISLYVDGIRVNTNSAPAFTGILSSSSPISIGSRKSAQTTNYNNQFIGTIDEVAIYNYALTSDQILNHFYAAQYPPIFTIAPTNTVANEGSTVTFYSSAYSPSPLSYQWFDVTAGEPGVLMSGQTSSNLVLANVSTSLNGHSFRVVATGPHGSTTSPDLSLPAAQLTVNSGPPVIQVDAPAQMFVYAGRTIVIPVSVSGTAPFNYQWTSNGVVVANVGRVTGANSNVLVIAVSQVSDSATYQLMVSNGSGGPVSSTPTVVTVSAHPGFNGNGFGWGLNGDATHGPATISGNVLQLTTGAGSTARSAFFNYRLNITDFLATFTYQDVNKAGADGFAFIVQNDARGASALGGAGGAVGYSGITPSAAVLFNIYANNTPGIGLKVNGATGGPYSPTPPVDISNGNPIDVALRYSNGNLQITLKDTVTSGTFVTNIVADLPALAGGQTAYVGFSGGDGGTTSIQNVSNFAFVNYTSLSAQTVGNSLVLSWPSSIGGYVLQTKSDLNGATWQNVAAPITQSNGQNTVTITPLTGNQFYRLALP